MSSSATLLARVGICVAWATSQRLLLGACALTPTFLKRVDLHPVVISTRHDLC